MDSVPPSSSSPKERPLTFVYAALWTIAAVMLIVLGIGVSEAIRPGASHDLVTIAAAHVLGYSLVLFAILRVHEPETQIRKVLALRMPHVLVMVFAIVAGAAIAPLSDTIESLITARFPPPQDVSDSIEKMLAITTTGKRAVLVAALVFVIPTCEELFFRGALFTPLERDRRVGTVVLATAAYEVLGVVQASPIMAVAFLPSALLFAWLRGTTGSILPSVLARIAFFGVQYLPIAFGLAVPRTPPMVLAAAVAMVLVSTFGVTFIERRNAPDASE